MLFSGMVNLTSLGSLIHSFLCLRNADAREKEDVRDEDETKR